MWQNSIYHPTNYEMTKFIFSAIQVVDLQIPLDKKNLMTIRYLFLKKLFVN